MHPQLVFTHLYCQEHCEKQTLAKDLNVIAKDRAVSVD